MKKHWPVVLFLVGAYFGVFAPIHEFFHLVAYFLETGRTGTMHWNYVIVPGAGSFTYASGYLFEAILGGILLIAGNRWLKYYGFSVIINVIVMWYGSADYLYVTSAALANLPMITAISALCLGLAINARRGHGENGTYKAHYRQTVGNGAGAETV